jgi:hypothetical protein
LGIADDAARERLSRVDKVAHGRTMAAGKAVLDLEFPVLPELIDKGGIYSGAQVFHRRKCKHLLCLNDKRI